MAIGNFPPQVILSEDMYVAAKLVLAHWHLIYQAQACCFHSHNYTLAQEFKRYFDIGVFSVQQAWIKQQVGNAEHEGWAFVLSAWRFLMGRDCYYLPHALSATGLKY